MATYRKLLKNRAGDTIIPVVDVLNYLYPVGSIYMSATMSTVAEVEAAFGGTWVAWGTGRVPVGVDTSQTEFNTVEKTGGAKTHTLTVAEMPSHKHPLPYRSSGGGSGSTWYCDPGTADGYSDSKSQAVGGGGAHNNLQPYITCYMYKRVADSNGGANEPTNPGGKK